MTLLLKPNPSSGVPIYVQLKEQIRHAVEIGALRPGEPLPAMRLLAEQLVINANTVARVYRELESEGLLVLRHGIGAFVSEFGPATARTESLTTAQATVREVVGRLRGEGLTADEIRRLVEAELERGRAAPGIPAAPVNRVAAAQHVGPSSTEPRR